MISEATSQLHSYHAFVKATLQRGGMIGKEATPEAFIEYQQQLAKLRRDLAPAAERFYKGEPAQKLDFDAVADDVLGAR